MQMRLFMCISLKIELNIYIYKVFVIKWLLILNFGNKKIFKC